MRSTSDHLFQELTDALQVLAALSGHVRHRASETAKSATQIEAAVDRAITRTSR